MGKNKLIVYGVESSPACQSVFLTLKALGLSYELSAVNTFKGDNRSKHYLQLNPAHTIPTLDDNGDIIGDSHAIMAYLVCKYATNDKLYPKELVRRARVDQLMHFDNAVLFETCVHRGYRPIFTGAATEIPAHKLQTIAEAYNTLERFFGNNCYVADKHMTIADFCCFSSVASLQLIAPLSEERHPKVHAWYERMREFPYMEEVYYNENVLRVMNFLRKRLAKL